MNISRLFRRASKLKFSSKLRFPRSGPLAHNLKYPRIGGKHPKITKYLQFVPSKYLIILFIIYNLNSIELINFVQIATINLEYTHSKLYRLPI